MLRHFFVSFLLCASSLPAQQEWQAQSEEEALFLRRIADFWDEGEYQIVQSEIEEFLREYPESAFTQTLHASLGDLYVRNGNFKGALMQYSRIDDPSLSDKIFLNRMQCLLELQWFATLSDECVTFLEGDSLSLELKQRATHLLAISLYQQCLSAAGDAEVLERLAKRAIPYFQELLQHNLSEEIAQASAHLFAVLQNYEEAAQVYLSLSQSPDVNKEEMEFQAALFQAKYNKPLALQTFQNLAKSPHPRAQDAIYNALVLSYDCKQYDAILSDKENILAKIPSKMEPEAHLFFGKSYLQQQHYQEALDELLVFINMDSSLETKRIALIDLFEAAYQLENLSVLEEATNRLLHLCPNDAALPKGYLCQALLQKRGCQQDVARTLFQKIQQLYPEAPECQIAHFEEIHLDFHEQKWKECRECCQSYLQYYGDSAQASFVWRFFATSSANLCKLDPSIAHQEQLVADLQKLFDQPNALEKEEKSEWVLLQAKTYYELERYTSSIAVLDRYLQDEPSCANGRLLRALSFRDGFHNLTRFCTEAEEALDLGPDLIDPPSLHIALFNAYLDTPDSDAFEKAANHLYLASQSVSIDPENLLWLANYYDQADIHPERAAYALETFLSTSKVPMDSLDEDSLLFEKPIVKLAELYGKMGEVTKKLSLLESLQKQQEANPIWNWQETDAVDMQLANQYEQIGRKDRALTLYDRLASKNTTLRSAFSAAAALKGARLRIAELPSLAKPELFKAISLLKTLSLQKNISNEPLHLEASLDYIDLQTELEEPTNRLQKRLLLLKKAKKHFENQEDLLSIDYHAGLEKHPEKKRLYQAYLTLFHAEILYCKSALTTEEAKRDHLLENAKKVYEEILQSPVTDYLAGRARKQLELILQ